jgi:hypothetical protein
MMQNVCYLTGLSVVCMILIVQLSKLVDYIFSRGFSRGNGELLRPLPEKAEEPMPLSYVETVKEALSSLYLSEDNSNCSTPVNQTHRTDVSVSSLPSESSHAWSLTTGTLTGRSSVYSWGNDNVRKIAKCKRIYHTLV